MRLLLDSTFPEATKEHPRKNVSMERFVAGDVADRQLLEYAAANAFDAVVFMGRDALVAKDLRHGVAETGIAVVATTAREPTLAQDQLVRNLGRLERRAKPGRIYVLLSDSMVEE